MDYVEKRKSGTLLYDGKVVKLEVDEVLLPNGEESKREIIRHSGGACVVRKRRYRRIYSPHQPYEKRQTRCVD